tara:strand:- start:291 stop:545 length:255 start_codon:yes stop_codon:yes gene_type:complete
LEEEEEIDATLGDYEEKRGISEERGEEEQFLLAVYCADMGHIQEMLKTSPALAACSDWQGRPAVHIAVRFCYHEAHDLYSTSVV